MKKHNFTGNDYVVVSRQAWEKPLGSNARDMVRVLSTQGRVLFVNPPLDWALRLRRHSELAQIYRHAKRTYGPQRLIEVEPNLWVFYPRVTLASLNWLPDTPLYDRLNRYSSARFAGEIQYALNQLALNPFVLLNDNDIVRGFYLKEMLRPAAYVYYSRDYSLAVDYWRKHGARLEPQLMRKADLVAANSAYLAELAARYNPNSVDIGQGCDLQQFDVNAQYPLPDDLAALPTPRIGYTGAITSLRLDVSLLEYTAKTRPDWHIVMVGKEDEVFQNSVLHQLPNVHFLGSKPPEQIPAYVQHLDVLINPQRINEVTLCNYPRKVDEYLAMGKPVVAVRTPTMEMFREYVFLADDLAQFVQGLDEALRGQGLATPESRVAFAYEHTWERCISTLKEAISHIIKH